MHKRLDTHTHTFGITRERKDSTLIIPMSKVFSTLIILGAVGKLCSWKAHVPLEKGAARHLNSFCWGVFLKCFCIPEDHLWNDFRSVSKGNEGNIWAPDEYIFFFWVTGIIDILLETNIKSIRVGRPTTSHDRFLVPVHLRCLNRHLVIEFKVDSPVAGDVRWENQLNGGLLRDWYTLLITCIYIYIYNIYIYIYIFIHTHVYTLSNI